MPAPTIADSGSVSIDSAGSSATLELDLTATPLGPAAIVVVAFTCDDSEASVPDPTGTAMTGRATSLDGSTVEFSSEQILVYRCAGGFGPLVEWSIPEGASARAVWQAVDYAGRSTLGVYQTAALQDPTLLPAPVFVGDPDLDGDPLVLRGNMGIFGDADSITEMADIGTDPDIGPFDTDLLVWEWIDDVGGAGLDMLVYICADGASDERWLDITTDLSSPLLSWFLRVDDQGLALDVGASGWYVGQIGFDDDGGGGGG